MNECLCTAFPVGNHHALVSLVENDLCIIFLKDNKQRNILIDYFARKLDHLFLKAAFSRYRRH